MGRGSRIEKWKNMRNNCIIFSGSDNFSQTFMKVIVVAFCFSFILLYPLNSCEGFRGFCSGCFGLLFSTTLCSAFITVEIIETVESHKIVVSK